MITIKNEFSGASFNYSNENNCTANGEYRSENGSIVNININGYYDNKSFWAGRDSAGNVNISGVPVSVIAGVAGEVAAIIAAIEEVVNPSESTSEE